MNRDSIIFNNVTFGYEGAVGNLFEDLTAYFPTGWTGIVGANGSGKTTILKLATGGLIPVGGNIVIPDDTAYCPQRTDDMPPLLPGFVGSTDSEAARIRGQLGISADWPERWDTLSHGERKRSQIGVVLWKSPSVLAVDEPTNHLDSEARDLLAAALRAYAGAGLLVSHDRELLDMLCGQCLFVESPGGVIRPGGYSEGYGQMNVEDDHIRERYAHTKSAYKKLKREAARRRESASRADKKRSKGKLRWKDSDAREKIDRARITGKDGVDGKLLRQLSGRQKKLKKDLEGIKVRKTYRADIWLEGACSKRNSLFNISEGTIPLGIDCKLEFSDLMMRPDDRVALTGPNGAGKSTLLNHILKSLNLPEGRLIYLPQEISLEDSREIINRARTLPNEKLGRMMTVVSCLGSRPQRLLESNEPSPGEIRKLLLAIGIADEPHLIIMDEPTNHLDLPSIESMETALSGCPCGLLLVSHDQRFLGNLARIRWDIGPDGGDEKKFVLRKI